MTDETFETLRDFVKANSVITENLKLTIPVFVSDEVPDDEPQFSGGRDDPEECALGIRLSPADFSDLNRRLDLLAKEQNECPPSL